MPRYFLTDKFGINYTIDAGWFIADKDDPTITFAVSDTFGNPRRVAQFTTANIIGLYESTYCHKDGEDKCLTCRYESLSSDQEPCCSCDDDTYDKWETQA